MAREDGVKAVLPRLVGYRRRDELHEVDAVLRERLERAVKCPGLVVGDERERRPPALSLPVEPRVRRERDEAGARLRMVADVARDHREYVQLSCALARARGLSGNAVPGDMAISILRRHG